MPLSLVRILIPCAIVSLTFFSYWDVQNHQFLNFDDNAYVKLNYYVKNGFSLDNIKWAFSFNNVSYWHPISWLSHMMDGQFFGINPSYHHTMNLAIHILNSILLFLIIFRMTGAQFKAALVAMLFAIHPLNVESVAWVSERKTVLSALFFMAAIYTYVHYTEKKKKWVYVSSLCIYALGLMSKPIILTFPILLFLLDYWPLKRFRTWDSHEISGSTLSLKKFVYFFRSDAGALLVEKVPFIILSLISLSISMASALYGRIVVNYQVVPIYLRIENFFVSIIRYLQNTVWSFELSIFYPFPKSIPTWHSLMAFAFIVMITLITYKTREKRSWLIVGWFWFIIALLPASGLIQAGLWPAIANRFMYLPSIGIFIAVIWECDQYLKGRYSHVLKIILCIAMLVYFSSLTRVQNLYFANSYALFNRCLAIVGDNDVAFTNIGDALASLGRVDEAMEYFEKSIKLNPGKNANAYNNYGICLVVKGDDQNAVPYFLRAVELDPNFTGSYLHLGLIEYRKGNVDEAVKLLSKALELDQHDLNVHYNLGVIFARQGRLKEAVKHYLFVIRRDPGYLPARVSLAQAYEDAGDYRKALTEYETLIETTPKSKAYVYFRIAGIYSQQKKFIETKDYLEIALKDEGFDVFENLKSDKSFKYFRETTNYTRFLENHGMKGQ